MEKKRELEFDIGIRSISILRYLAEYLDRLPISVLSRMFTTHDIPYLLIELLELRPWIKQNDDGKKMIPRKYLFQLNLFCLHLGDSLIYDGNWNKPNPNEVGKICKIEGQLWFGLRELLLSPKCISHYEITEHRLAKLLKVEILNGPSFDED